MVSATIEGLPPGSAYHFRAVAKNSAQEVAEGPDHIFATYALPQVFESCPNDAFRTAKPSAVLPDCRAYEQASPVAKNGGDVTNTVPFVAAADDGNAVTFISDGGIPGGEGSQELPLYLASRGAGSWSTQGLLPPPSVAEQARVIGWLPDLSATFSLATTQSNSPSTAFLARSSSGGALSTIFPYTAGADYFYAGASADGSLVLFETGAKPGTVLEGISKVYAWNRDSGKLSLVSVFNDETSPPKGAYAGSYDWMEGTNTRSLSEGGALREYYTQDQHVISADGSAVYFTASGTGQLYVRLNPTAEQSELNGEGECTEPSKACTVRVSASHRAVPDPAGARPAAFQGGSTDGSKTFFTSSEKLTDNANTGPEQEPAAIARADIDGKTESIELDFIPTHALGVAVDATHVYWANPGEHEIGRAKLDGSKVEETFIATGPGVPRYVAVDGTYLYWSNDLEELETPSSPQLNLHQSTIGRAKIGATEAEEVKPDFITGASAPQGVAVTATHIYWANANGVAGTANGNSGRSIGRANINGGEVEQKFHELDSPAASTHPWDLAVDGTHIYWSVTQGSGNGNFVARADLDGKNEIFVGVGEGSNAKGIALDGSHVYWTKEGSSTIGRANLDLGGVENEFIVGDGSLGGLDLDASHFYWSSNGESPPNPGNDLYRYDSKTGQLTNLTPDPNPGDPNGAEVKGVLGTSDDGSYVYFTANGDLDEAGLATSGNCSGALSNGMGSCSLYLSHEGEISFVTRLNGADGADWTPGVTGKTSLPNPKTARVTPDGQTLLFSSKRQLTAYENEGTAELYRYHAPDESLLCVSCNPNGEAPTGGPGLGSITTAVILPTAPQAVLSRALSNDGKRVFFETTEALVAADTNADGGCPLVGFYLAETPSCMDVYEWEAQGAGSCETPAGCFYLLSTGTEESPSQFAGASASGDDVFIYTRSKLVGQDTDGQRDVYDLRVGGGLASQYPQPRSICEAEGCKAAASAPPASQSAGSAAFAGPPNPKPNHGHKKARHKRKKHHKRHRRAHADRKALR